MKKVKHKIFSYLKNRIRDLSYLHGNILDSSKIKGSIIDSRGEIKENVQIEYSSLKGNNCVNKNVKIFQSEIKGEVKIESNCSIEKSILSGKIEVGEGCKINQINLNGFIKVGRYTSLMGPNSDLTTNYDLPIEIGNFCSIARNVSFQTFNHNSNKVTTYFIGRNLFKEKWENETFSKGGITLENDIWVGAHSVILGGVKISNGAVVAANSVVNKDIPPYAVVAGVPAKIIDYRFPEQIIEKLLESKWWDWENEKLKRNKEFFESVLDTDFDFCLIKD